MSLLLHIIVTYIKENIIPKLQKLYSPARNPRAGNKSPMLFVKNPLCLGNLSPVCKIFIERPMRWNRTSCCEFNGKSMETETTTWSEFLNGGEAIVKQILVSKERNRSKKAGLWESQSGIGVGKLTMWGRSFEIEKL